MNKKKFIGREKELREIQKYIDSNDSYLGILYGIRRVGKTSILKQLLKKNRGIYYSADASGLENNLQLLSNKITNFFGTANYIFSDFYQLFIYFKDQNLKKRKKTILIIDEFSYLVETNSEVNSIFKTIVDEYLENSNIKIILSGSHLGIMKSLRKYDNPLYQRVLFQKQILPFDYLEASLFYPTLTSFDKIQFYSVFGGMPFVLNKINPKKNLKNNINEIYLKNDDILNTDVITILGHENKKVNSYIPILNCIAGKNRQIKDISVYTKKPTSVILPLINNLLEMEILKKEISFGENSFLPKKTNYSFQDPYFNFCYYFLRNKLSEFVILDHDTFFKNYIENSLKSFIGLTFKKICQTFLKKYYHTNIIKIGRYWDNNYKSKENLEIDIILEQLNDQLIFFECKFTNKPIGDNIVKKIINHAEILKKKYTLFSKKEIKFGFFSCNGFQKNLSDKEYLLFTPEDLYEIKT